MNQVERRKLLDRLDALEERLEELELTTAPHPMLGRPCIALCMHPERTPLKVIGVERDTGALRLRADDWEPGRHLRLYQTEIEWL